MRNKSREVQLAWFAGFFDGEGTCGIYTVEGRFQYRMTIAQKDARPLVLIQELFGGKVYHPPASQGQYQWHLVGEKSVILAREFLSYSSNKIDQLKVYADSWAPRITGSERELIVAMASIELKRLKREWVQLADILELEDLLDE
jgi:hypothetical protein